MIDLSICFLTINREIFTLGNNDFYKLKKNYYYDLPEEQIAQTPIEPRDSSRLLVCKDSEGLEETVFSSIIDYFNPGDVLVLNKSKVIPARLFATKINANTSVPGAKLEMVLLERDNSVEESEVWTAIVRPGKKALPGVRFLIGDKLVAEIISVEENGNRRIKFHFDRSKSDFYALLDEVGVMPLPPYITEKLHDNNRYQTVYADTKGSAAAPTAGLHFTPELLKRIENKGVKIVSVILHVGLGTFRPVKADNIDDHVMHSEYYILPEETAKVINEAKLNGKRVIAVGTTSFRTMEGSFSKNGCIKADSGYTNIFIYPGKSINVVDGLITNFHLPESTLIMLVCAFYGYKNTMHAYEYAVKNGFRFFSFGDAMFIPNRITQQGDQVE